eukprot:1589366-Amphidinium_carterae.1
MKTYSPLVSGHIFGDSIVVGASALRDDVAIPLIADDNDTLLHQELLQLQQEDTHELPARDTVEHLPATLMDPPTYTCAICQYVAKTNAGLAVHTRRVDGNLSDSV